MRHYPKMPLPRPLTNLHKFDNCPNPVWQVSPMTESERAEVKALLTELERRLVPAEPATVREIAESVIKPAKSAPERGADGLPARMTNICTGYSDAHVRASLAACGGNANLLADDLRRRRDNTIVYRYRCRVLLGLQPAQWYETPGATCPEGPDKPFDKPVFGPALAPISKAA